MARSSRRTLRAIAASACATVVMALASSHAAHASGGGCHSEGCALKAQEFWSVLPGCAACELGIVALGGGAAAATTYLALDPRKRSDGFKYATMVLGFAALALGGADAVANKDEGERALIFPAISFVLAAPAITVAIWSLNQAPEERPLAFGAAMSCTDRGCHAAVPMPSLAIVLGKPAWSLTVAAGTF